MDDATFDIDALFEPEETELSKAGKPITPGEPIDALQDEKMTKLADANWAAYERARDSGHMEWVDDADKYDSFYTGDQWDSADLSILREEGRPALTINKILPTISAWIGEQTSRRADIKFKPKKDGAAAFALTKLSMAVDDANNYHWLETEYFTDGCITDRGYIRVLINTDSNIAGDIVYKVLNPRQVLLDPTARGYDPKGWREWTYVDWVSMDEIKATYGDEVAGKVKDIAATETGTYGIDSVILEEHRFGDANKAAASSWTLQAGAHEGESIKKVRIITREYKRFERVPHFVDYNTSDVRRVPETWDEERVASFAEQMELGIVMRVASQIYITVSVDKTVLHHSKSPYKTFSIIPYFPYFRRGKPFGVVRNLISPQEQINKLESQELHIVNTTANSGWMLESGSLVNMSADELREQGAKSGIVLEYAQDRDKPEKIQPNTVPTGIDRISAKASNHIKEISSISDSVLGMDSPEVSGVAIRMKQNRGNVQIAGPMDNLARTRSMLAYKKLELIQQFYTEERVIQYTDMTDPEAPDQELMLNQIDAAGDIINDVTIGTYEVVVGTAPARDVFEESQFAEALELRNAGVAIPDDVVVAHSSLENKDDIAERVREASGQGTPSDEEIAMMQMQQQLNQQMQMIELKRAQLELATLEGELNLITAKATAEDNVDERHMQTLEEKIQEKREEMELRKELARMTNSTKLAITDRNNDAKLATELIKLRSKPTAEKTNGPRR